MLQYDLPSIPLSDVSTAILRRCAGVGNNNGQWLELQKRLKRIPINQDGV